MTDATAPHAPLRIGIVTCAQLPEPDHDQEPLLRALGERGANATLVPWNAPAEDPRELDLCVLRSCWDYHLAPEAFRRWIRGTAAHTTLLNPPQVLLENIHKGYLAELERAGVPVVPTRWFERGASVPEDALAATGWEEVVIKPAISGSSHGTRRLRVSDPEAYAFLDERLRVGDAMVQPFLPSVEREGERALVWIDGEFTHAIRKDPRFCEDDESVSPALELSEHERRFAEAALSPVLRSHGEGLLYARVDVMLSDTGELLLSELELLEPSLFLLQSPHALSRFADALLERARAAQRARASRDS